MSQEQNPQRFKGRKRINVSPEEATRLFQTPHNQDNGQNSNQSPSMQRPTGIEPPEQIHINNLADLYELIKNLKPSKDSTNDAKPIVYHTKGTSLADEKFNGYVTIPQSGGDSTVRQALIEGFEMIRNHQICHEAQLTAHESPEDFGGYLPARVPDPEDQITWLDSFVNRRLGGRREGLFVVWELAEGKYQMDPWTCEIKQIDA